MPLLTAGELLSRLSGWLAGREVDSARLEAELMLAHVLGCPRLELYLRLDQPLVETELSACRELARQRGKRRPLAHILGSAHFWGLELSTGAGALVPRPETEILVEQVIRASLPGLVLEFGAGTAAIGLAVCAECRNLCWLATEFSAEALQLACLNRQYHSELLEPRGNRLLLFRGDGFQAVAPRACISLIVSNPPYIPTDELSQLMPEVQHDPSLALDGGQDGLKYHRLLIKEGASRLEVGAKLLLEIAPNQEQVVCELLEQARFSCVSHQDLNGRVRVISAIKAT